MKLPIKWYCTAFADDPGENEECHLIELSPSHAVWGHTSEDVLILWSESEGYSYKVVYSSWEKVVKLYEANGDYVTRSGIGYTCTPIYEEP